MVSILLWRDSPYCARVSLLSSLCHHIETHHTWLDSSGRVIRPTQIPLPDNTQHSQETDIYAPGWIRTHDPSKRATAYPRLRPRGPRDGLWYSTYINLRLVGVLTTCHTQYTWDRSIRIFLNLIVHNEELNDLYSSPNIVRVIKSRRMRWAGHVARMGEERGVYRVLVGKPEGKRPLRTPRRRW